MAPLQVACAAVAAAAVERADVAYLAEGNRVVAWAVVDYAFVAEKPVWVVVAFVEVAACGMDGFVETAPAAAAAVAEKPSAAAVAEKPSAVVAAVNTPAALVFVMSAVGVHGGSAAVFGWVLAALVHVVLVLVALVHVALVLVALVNVVLLATSGNSKHDSNSINKYVTFSITEQQQQKLTKYLDRKEIINYTHLWCRSNLVSTGSIVDSALLCRRCIILLLFGIIYEISLIIFRHLIVSHSISIKCYFQTLISKYP